MTQDRPTVEIMISIDTEEDSWGPTAGEITTRNIERIPELDRFFKGLGVRGTYFTTYQVATAEAGAAILRDVSDGGDAEIGAHLHPWNTPPYSGEEPRLTMLRDYPIESQQAKLFHLLESIETDIGVRPTSFRAGRFGVGRETILTLIEAGITVDSSVTPLLNWREAGGPSFMSATNDVYRVDGTRDVSMPSPEGPVVEVPVTVGFTRSHPRAWNSLARVLDSRLARRARIQGLLGRTTGTAKVILSPEVESGPDMVSLGRHLVCHGATKLHMYFHSNSLCPGLTPFTCSEAEVKRLYDRIEVFLEGMAQVAHVTFRTVSEAAEEVSPVMS